MNMLFFITSEQFTNYHRRPEIEIFAQKLLPKGEKVIVFTRPKLFNCQALTIDKVSENIFSVALFSLIPLKFAFKHTFLMKWLVNKPIRWQISKINKKLNLKNTVEWIYKPDQYLSIIGKAPYIYLHYDNYEGDAAYPFSHDKSYKIVEENTLKNSLFSLVASTVLLKRFTKKIANEATILYYPNALSHELLPSTITTAKVANEKKIIGFVGQIDDTFDANLLSKIAKRFPQADIVIVGPVKNNNVLEICKAFTNITFKGFVKYEDLKNQICQFDVAICPYALNEFNQYRNPLKIYEYFSYGVPVVTVCCDIDPQVSDLLTMTNNQDEFLNNIDSYLQFDTTETKNKRFAFAQKNTWDKRAEQVIAAIGSN